jgi:hypothetical protein
MSRTSNRDRHTATTWLRGLTAALLLVALVISLTSERFVDAAVVGLLSVLAGGLLAMTIWSRHENRETRRG